MLNQELGRLALLDTMMLNRNRLSGSLPDSFSGLIEIGKIMSPDNIYCFYFPESHLEFGRLVLYLLILNPLYFSTTDILLLDANNITGNADSICYSMAINTTAFSADCGTSSPEIQCSCCSICCEDSDPDCNNFDWRINLDGIWEYDYQRVVYSFSQEIMPASAKEDYGNGAP